MKRARATSASAKLAAMVRSAIDTLMKLSSVKAHPSTRGVVLPADVRRQLRLHQGASLAVEVRDGSIVLRPVSKLRRYKTRRHPASDLPVMVAVEPSGRKVTAAEIARLHAELL